MYKQKKHIGIVPDFRQSPPVRGGIDVYSLNMIKELSRSVSDYKYTIFIRKDKTTILPQLPENFSIYYINPLTKFNLIDIGWYLFLLPVIASKKKIDLLHLFSGNRRLTLYPPQKTVSTIHDIFQLYETNVYNRKQYLYFKWIIIPLLKKGHNFIAVSQSTALDLIRLLQISKNNIKVVTSCYDKEKFHQVTHPKKSIFEKYSLDKNFILYVSSIDHPRKNHINLIKAYAHLKKKVKDLPYIVCIGEDFFNSKPVYDEICNQNLSNHIKLLGYVPVNDLLEFYNSADFFVHPSCFEGFGFPIIEAMACGLPVVCSDIPAFREVGGDVAIYFNPNSPESIAEKLEFFLNNKIILESYSQKGLKKSCQFNNWTDTIKKVLSYYSECLDNNT